ncbi:hypothetical protein L3Y34_011734 [Caenorhabditis briggsae]|uniref:Uncharacterized protein n=1 Tax=Caenorhabditis briggsae TaxID=6238 RepID=A0AAE8ZQL8_CAEBR|nr:hypothetical protein L3Y34_011733 [Caenorhabditis briggsae]ULT81970.1 hypothetical protein L3Y34_011734 [Caenorhabditis briggsae]
MSALRQSSTKVIENTYRHSDKEDRRRMSNVFSSVFCLVKGAIKLACSCDAVDFDVLEGSEIFEEETMEEQHSVQDNQSQVNASIDHHWDSQNNQFLGHADPFYAPRRSVMSLPMYANFQDAVRIAREEYPTAQCL